MTTIITNGRFEGDLHDFVSISEVNSLDNFYGNLDLSSDVDPAVVVPHAQQFASIRIAFPSSHDGRGNSIAKALRRAGYAGHLRAFGNVLADQYPLVIRSGFDDVEISDEQARRQPEAQWIDAHGRLNGAYLARLRSHVGVKKAVA